MATNKNQYIPGVCNIGRLEIKKRWQIGWLGLVLTILFWGGFILFGVSPAWRLFLFFPATVSAFGFIQATRHFCAYFGLASLFNFNEAGKTDSVQQAEFRA